MDSSLANPVIPPDTFADVAPTDVQQQAARLVQEAFAATLRLTAQSEGTALEQAMAHLGGRLREWSQLATTEGRHLRLAMILSGLDQWGLAYAQAFGAGCLQGLSLLLTDLRGSLDLSSEGMCQRFLDTLRGEEAAALDFKISVRRELHLSLWHTMIAAESRADAEPLMRLLGGLLLALLRLMPELGWRLVADTLASIQIRCLAHGLASEGLAQELTAELFAALKRELPETLSESVFAHAAAAVLAWQESQRATHH